MGRLWFVVYPGSGMASLHDVYDDSGGIVQEREWSPKIVARCDILPRMAGDGMILGAVCPDGLLGG
jgi:hypothetical protein